ncbi:MAG: hypothetical protein ACQEQL_00355 [Pseudomonadota bacterium]
MGWNETLRTAFLAATVAMTGNAFAQNETVEQAPVDNDATSIFQTPSAPQEDVISVHSPTGCEAYASSAGVIELACFGNPYHGDPNPGMIITVDLAMAEVKVMNRYEITEDGQFNDITDPQLQTYPLSFTQDVKEANKTAEKMGLESPSLLEMGRAYRERNDETGLYQAQSESSNLSVTYYDTGKISKSLVMLDYSNPDDGSITRVSVTPNKVAVQTGQPGGTQSISLVDIGQASFTAADFRDTQTADAPETPKSPKASTKKPGGPSS